MGISEIMSIVNAGLTLIWVFLAAELFKIQVQTFASQLDTFKEQQKISELELKKFKYAIRPQFIFCKPSTLTPYDDTEEDYTVNIRYDIKLIKNVALDFRIKNISKLSNEKLDSRTIDHVNINDEFPIIAFQLLPPQLDFEYYAEISFTDEVGTKYKQILKGTMEDIHIGPPIEFV